MLVFCLALPSTHAFLQQQQHDTRAPFARIRPQQSCDDSSLLPKLFSMSTEQEEQAFEAIQSLADFHQGEWKGRANSFAVTPDVAAGVVKRKTSPEYNVAVKLSMTTDQDQQQFSLSETISWDDHSKMAFRSLPVQDTDFDVDAVDASYSLDATTTALSEFPSMLSATEKPCEFLIEHCIATGENRRARCFALYGEDESLIRVIISNEERILGDKASLSSNGDGSTEVASSNSNNAFTAKDLMEMQNDVDRLVDKIVSQMDSRDNPAATPTPSTSFPSPLQNSDVTDSYTKENVSSRLGRLGDGVSSKEGTQDLAPHDITLLELSSGVWLGDAIIRDLPGIASSPMERGRGFGSPQGGTVEKDSWKTKTSRPFGSWGVSVQKIAWRWMWNFGEEIRQVTDVGKALGSPLDPAITKSLAGNVCVDESLSRRIPKEERMVYVDWSQNDSVGFLLGSCAVQVPRYINFDPAATATSRTLNKPFFTEFSVFQSAGDKDDNSAAVLSDIQSADEDMAALPNLICSKISRLYNYEGKLKQGCSSFYTFNRFGPEDTD